jgi:hypothetical protein
MALNQNGGELIACTPKQTQWRMLGCVLYQWADRRDPAVDRMWWQRARPHLERLRLSALSSLPAEATVEPCDGSSSYEEEHAFAPLQSLPQHCATAAAPAV